MYESNSSPQIVLGLMWFHILKHSTVPSNTHDVFPFWSYYASFNEHRRYIDRRTLKIIPLYSISVYCIFVLLDVILALFVPQRLVIASKKFTHSVLVFKDSVRTHHNADDAGRLFTVKSSRKYAWSRMRNNWSFITYLYEKITSIRRWRVCIVYEREGSYISVDDCKGAFCPCFEAVNCWLSARDSNRCVRPVRLSKYCPLSLFFFVPRSSQEQGTLANSKRSRGKPIPVLKWLLFVGRKSMNVAKIASCVFLLKK